MTDTKVFHRPVALAVITAIGLVVALVGGPFFYPISWVALLIPLVVLVIYWRRARLP